MSQSKVSFYFNIANREQALCQLVGKAMRQKLAIGVLTGSEAASQQIDRLLWERPPTGFLPHCLADQPEASQTPTLISHQLDALLPCDVLFNWTDAALPGQPGLQRIIEMVEQGDEAGRLAARQRVAGYKQAGYEVDYTDMAKLAQGGT